MIDYDRVMQSIMDGDLESLELVARENDDFPAGNDHFAFRAWLRNAIDCGTLAVVNWMLAKGSPVNYTDDEGYPALHAAIDRELPDQVQIVELLCAAGADINARGLNDWTPLHMAAARNNVEALKVLLQYGADPQIRTRIDDHTTPFEEAQKEAAKFLSEFT